MSRYVTAHRERAPSNRLTNPAQAVFFPGEVARLLGLTDIEYDQLRRLYKLARASRGLERPGREWSRFTLVDLACTEVLVGLGRSRGTSEPARRLILGNIEDSCEVLRRLGVENPLLEVPLGRIGRQIVALVDGYVFEPTSGQVILDRTVDLTALFLQDRAIQDARILRAVRRERARARRRSRLRIDDVHGRTALPAVDAM